MAISGIHSHVLECRSVRREVGIEVWRERYVQMAGPEHDAMRHLKALPILIRVEEGVHEECIQEASKRRQQNPYCRPYLPSSCHCMQAKD